MQKSGAQVGDSSTAAQKSMRAARRQKIRGTHTHTHQIVPEKCTMFLSSYPIISSTIGFDNIGIEVNKTCDIDNKD